MSGSIPGVRAGLEKSLRARSSGYDGSFLSEFAGPVAVARKLADFLDDPDWPYVRDKFDNVTPAKFLDYCVHLGLVPESCESESVKRPVKAADELAKWREKRTG